MNMRILLFAFLTCLASGNQKLAAADPRSPSAPSAAVAAHMVDEDSFRQNMTHYIDRVRTLVTHHIMTQDLALEELLDRLKSSRSLSLFVMDDVIDHLTMTAQTIEHMHYSVKESVFDELRCALLVQLIVPLDIYLRNKVFEILDHVHSAIRYWQQQQQYPIYYFFHKSPLKIFKGQTQQREIEEKLFFLRGVQKSMFEFLGKWTLHITQFNRAATVQEQYAWLIRLLAIPYALIHGEQLETEKLMNYEKSLPILRDFTLKVDSYLHKVEVLVDTAHVPNHFERNWLHYSLAGMGSGIAALYAYRYQEKIPKIVDNFRNTIYNNFVKTPTEALCDAFPFLRPFIGKDLPEEPQKPADENLPQRATAVSEAFAQVIRNMQGNEENLTDVVLRRYYVQAVNDYFALRGQRTIRVEQATPDGAVHIVDRTISEQDLATNAERFDRGLIIQLINQCFTADLPASYMRMVPFAAAGISLLNICVQIMNRGGEAAKADMLNILHPALAEFLNATARESGNLFDQLKRLLKQNQVTFSFLACIPIAVIAYGGAKGLKSLYHWWMHKDYTTIRHTLISIAHLLNLYEDIHPQQMRIEHYGELLYLGHKLKNEKRKVPSELRPQFMLDIERLEGNMSAQKKLYVIDLMYKSYPFLSYAKVS